MTRIRTSGGALAVLALALATPQAADAAPLLSEVFYDAVGSDDGQSFVEIWGVPGTPLDGLVVEGVNGSNGEPGPSLVLEGAIAPDGLFVIADVRADGSTDVATADALANFDFQNGPDSVVLRTADGVVLDAVGYGEFAPGEFFAGEGAPAPDAPAGSSLARWFADVDRDDNALDFGVLSEPTPGTALLAVPEPGAALLMGSALGGLAALARRTRRIR